MTSSRRAGFIALAFVAFLAACSAGGGTHSGSSLTPNAGDRRTGASTVSFGALAVAINCGGPATGYFSSDKFWTDASTGLTDTSPIAVSAANAAPAAVYAKSRTAANTLNYAVTGLTPNAAYTGYLHFEEPQATGAGQRIESVSVGGIVIAPALDIYAVAGAAHTAVVLPFTANTDANGTLQILLTSQVGAVIIAGYEIYQALPPTPSPSPSPALGPLAAAVNAGGPSTGYFIADKYFYGASSRITDSSPINVSVPNAAPAAVYSSSRAAASTLTYNVTGLTPDLAYAGYLHFEEPEATGPGQRVESVSVGGIAVSPALDIYAAAGAAHTAVVLPFAANADGTGTLQILITSQVGAPIMAGFEIYQAVTPSPTPSPPPAQAAGMSDAFVNSFGVNVHMSYFQTLYSNFGVVQSLLSNLGVRHVRDVIDLGNASICNEDVTLAASGIHFDVISPTPLSLSNLAAWMSCIGPAADEVEGPNEYDIFGDSNWVADLRAFQPTLYNAYAGTLPVLAPSVADEVASATALGSLSAYVTNGNMHSYFAGNNPGTSGFGSTDSYGTYGSLSRYIAVAGIISGSAPVQSTETGYSDAADTDPVPASTKADYSLRTLLEDWNAGVARTYVYELIDEGTVPFSHYGLVDSSGNVKPAYTAIQSLLAHLTDPGPAFTPTPLNFSFTATASTVQRTLLEKRNGTYELIVWNEVPEWNTSTNTPITVAPATASLGFYPAPHAVAQTTFNAAGNPTTTSLASGTTVTFTVTSSPIVLDISR